MSPQFATDVYTPPRTITKFRSWPVLKPLVKPALDFLVGGVGAISPQVLTHQPKPGFEQIERCAKRVTEGGSGWSGGRHAWIVASSRAMRHAAAHPTCLSHEIRWFRLAGIGDRVCNEEPARQRAEAASSHECRPFCATPPQPKAVQSGGNPCEFHGATFHGTPYRYHKGCNTRDSSQHPTERSISFEAIHSPFWREFERSSEHFSQQLPAVLNMFGGQKRVPSVQVLPNFGPCRGSVEPPKVRALEGVDGRLNRCKTC
jgi:hypothetical protein